jgi:hypothetical protein
MTGGLPFEQTLLLYILSIWSLAWKGLALWRASQQSQRNWFVVILVLNTVGILDIIFLFRFSKRRMTMKEITGWFKATFSSKPKSK